MGSPHRHGHHHLLCVYLLVAQATIQGIHAGLMYYVNNNAEGTKGGRRFETEIDDRQYVMYQMVGATILIMRTFNQKHPDDTKPVAKVTLNVVVGHDSKDFEVIKTEFEVIKTYEIEVSAKYIENYEGNDLKEDFTRRLYHAMANILQWTGKGTIPQSLKEGIADFIVLKAGKAPSDWKMGQGQKWDESSSVTALFLKYCDEERPRFVAELNEKLKNDEYDPKYMDELLGVPVLTMWNRYKAKYP